MTVVVGVVELLLDLEVEGDMDPDVDTELVLLGVREVAAARLGLGVT